MNQMKMRIQQSKICGIVESNPKLEIHSITGLSQETRKSSNNLTSQLKELELEQETKPKVSRRKEIILIRVEKSKRVIEKINKPDQDGGVGRHTAPPCTTKRRKTTI